MRPARIVAVGNVKGGAGKTITAVEVALHLAALGYRVLLVDTDPGRSALSWAARARTRHLWPAGLETFAHPFPDAGARLAYLGAGFDFVVVDTPPSPDEKKVGPTLAGVVKAADFVIVPTKSDPIDVDRLPDLIAHLERAGRPWGLLLVDVDFRRPAANRALRHALDAHGWPLFPIPVPSRSAVSGAFGSGRPLLHYEPAVDHLLGLMTGTEHARATP